MITEFTYLNREFAGYVPCIEKFRSICFRPLHYFFEGKTYFLRYSRDDTVRWESYESYPADQHTRSNNLKMAVLIIPALAVGVVATIITWIYTHFCWFSTEYSNLRSRLAAIEETPIFRASDALTNFELPIVELSENFSLNESHAALSRRWDSFIEKLPSRDSWKNPAIRTECGQLIEGAYVEMVLVFKHAARAANNDPEKMAKLMARTHISSDINGENYCRCFFYKSIGSIYFAARVALGFAKDRNGRFDRIYPSGRLTWRDSQPFFTAGAPEYRWRRLYNAACALIDEYPGLREALNKEDYRFLTCAKPDYTASNWPSDWLDRPTLRIG